MHIATNAILTAMALLAPRLGPQGVALGYTITHVLLLAPLVTLAVRAGLCKGMFGPLWRTAVVVSGTVGAAALVSIVLKFPTILGVAASGVVFLVLIWLARPLHLVAVVR